MEPQTHCEKCKQIGGTCSACSEVVFQAVSKPPPLPSSLPPPLPGWAKETEQWPIFRIRKTYFSCDVVAIYQTHIIHSGTLPAFVTEEMCYPEGEATLQHEIRGFRIPFDQIVGIREKGGVPGKWQFAWTSAYAYDITLILNNGSSYNFKLDAAQADRPRAILAARFGARYWRKGRKKWERIDLTSECLISSPPAKSVRGSKYRNPIRFRPLGWL